MASPDSTDAIEPDRRVRAPTAPLRGLILLLTILAVMATLKYARDALIPITLAVFLGYALMPLVTWLKKRLRVPLALGAALALLLLLGTVGLGVTLVQPQFGAFVDTIPKATQKLKVVLHRTSLDRTSAVRRLTTAADEIVRATAQAPAATPPVVANFNLREHLWTGIGKLAGMVAQGVIVLALSYFLLISGQDFKRKLVRISGDRLRSKKLTVQILDEIDLQIQRYLMIQITTSAAVGVLTGLAFAAVGLDNALFWGIAAGVLHLIPYVGPTLVIGAAALFAYVQFSAIHSVVLVVGSATAIAVAIGLVVVPWLMQRVGQMNAVATFATLIVWDWLWGVPGLLLGVPIMMAVMVVGERIDMLRPLGEFLSVESARAVPVPPPAPPADAAETVLESPRGP
ncbi:MAG: hypothetical protein K0Q76_3492 [Panacagrimonas sp.]|jgi:predicted PurR-regulated permease PerM|nr:AI-2E family transporter [Panacagrimonas sp.]MCC2658384.1 hypothetical protein [Panacagrimonas sp.]